MRLAGVMMLAGCNTLLGIEATVLDRDAGTNGGVCSPLPFDRGRYTEYRSSEGFAWTTARSNICGQYGGQDLVVVNANDDTEIAQAFNLGGTPYWTGISYDGSAWRSIDGCEPALPWAANEPVTERIGDCALRTNGGLASRSCNDQFEDGVAIRALCETPRPSLACQVLTSPSHSTYTRLAGGNAVRENAAGGCLAMGAHLVEINSTSELEQLRLMFSGVPFWLAAVAGTNTWSSATSCPQVFPWKAGEPTLSVGLCAFVDTAGAAVNPCLVAASAEVICETNTAE